MEAELTYDLQDIGKYSEDAVESEVARADLEEFVQTMNEYNVVADPENDRYIVNDDQHQYFVEIQHSSPIEDEVMVYINEADTGFTNDTLFRTNVMDDGKILEDQGDGAIFNDPSKALISSAEEAPTKKKRGF